MKPIFLVSIFISLFFYSCSKFVLSGDTIQASSDGSYVIETALSDAELLTYGKEVVYRFKTVPNMLAIKSIAVGRTTHNYYTENNIYKIPDSNQKKRNGFNYTLSQPANNSCYNAYCEAKFNTLINEIQVNNIPLTPITIAIIDSGVIPSTNSIKDKLLNSINLTKDYNFSNWYSHATYIASIFTGTTDQNGTKNVYASNAKLVSIKITFSDDKDAEANKNFGSMQLAVAIDQAVSLGAKIVNLSLSYSEKPDPNIELAEKIVISHAAQQGVLFVIAAGNESVDIEDKPVYPASYGLNNIITVGSHTGSFNMSYTSNYGNLVDISAQANQIQLNNKYGQFDYVSGTSFAAPIVASALALYRGIFPNASIDKILRDLFVSANGFYFDRNYSKRSTRYGRLDAKSFVEMGYSN